MPDKIFYPSGIMVKTKHAANAKRRRKSGSVYRDRITGRFVSKSTWKRSRVLASSRYKRESRYSANINVLGFDGYVSIVVRSFKQAQFDSHHLIAVNRFLRTGDTEWLKPFIGKSVGGVELLTDANRIHLLADAGLIKLDALYGNHGGRREQ